MSTLSRIKTDLAKLGMAPVGNCWEIGGDCFAMGGGGLIFDIGDNDYYFGGYSGGNSTVRDLPAATTNPVITRMTQCDCVHGTAYQDVTGACRCCEGAVIGGQCAGIKAPSNETPIIALPSPTPTPTAPPINASSILDSVKANPIPAALAIVGLFLLVGRK